MLKMTRLSNRDGAVIAPGEGCKVSFLFDDAPGQVQVIDLDSIEARDFLIGLKHEPELKKLPGRKGRA
jgi:hypothetical protein